MLDRSRALDNEYSALLPVTPSIHAPLLGNDNNYRSVPLKPFLYKSTLPVPQDVSDTKGLWIPIQTEDESLGTDSCKVCTNAFLASVSGIRSSHVHLPSITRFDRYTVKSCTPT